MSKFHYIGEELDLFALAHNWKSYWSSSLHPFVRGATLEVGAGIGSNTFCLDAGHSSRWVCLEPDPALTIRLSENLKGREGLPREVVCGTLETLSSDESFDTIVYIDVLEHIENDSRELALAATHLKPGGFVIVLSPAHQSLFTPFDAAIGHFRRYNKSMLRRASPSGWVPEKLFYLDSAGLFCSVANRLFLKQSMPTQGQILFWDRFVIPVSRVLDRLVFHALGKTIVGVWRKP